MAKKPKNLITAEDQAVIDSFNHKFEAYFDAMEKARQIQVGDYLVLKLANYDNEPLKIQTNSYGAPVKYKVVHSTKHGIPFVKRVNKKGIPVGRIYSCTGSLESDTFKKYSGQKFEFALDPDYADAILLQDDYDPANLHRSKKDIWKAVTDHNKACKVKTSDIKDVISFFSTVNIGDTLWTSNVSHFMVRDKKIMSPKDFNAKASWRFMTKIKGPYVPVLTVVDKSGKIRDISPDFFHRKALYKERPRTYKELNI
jgi:hypothetical protein